jgi:hypothetical protein
MELSGSFLLMVFCVFVTTGCAVNESPKEDRKEVALLTVSPEYVPYTPIEGIGIHKGIEVKEDNNDYRSRYPLGFIKGFNYEHGYEYRLKVLKTHLANPPADGFNCTYELLEIISKTPYPIL